MNKTLVFIVLNSLLLVISGCSVRDRSVDVVKGGIINVHGKSESFAFFTSSTNYQMLSDDKKDILAEDYVIDAPYGISADSVRTEVSVKKVDSGDGNYDAYIIDANLTLQISENLPKGKYSLTIAFPNAIKIRDLVNATTPAEIPKVSFEIRVYESTDVLANTKWRVNFLVASLLVLLSLIGLKIDNGFSMLIGGGLGIISIYYAFQSLKFLWLVSPWISLLLGLNLTISYEATYKKFFSQGS